MNLELFNSYEYYLGQESKIVWLVSTDQFDYVRELWTCCGRRTGRLKAGVAGHIVGYSELSKTAKSFEQCSFHRRIFYVCEHDRHTGDDAYKIGAPCEAVDPRTVTPGVRGELTDRAWGAPLATPKKIPSKVEVLSEEW